MKKTMSLARLCFCVLLSHIALSGCIREPYLHLYDMDDPSIDIPFQEVRLDVYWDVAYRINLGINYDWRAEWYYGQDVGTIPGWDDEDRRIFGELEYVEPRNFHLRRYFTGDVPAGKRQYRREAYLENTRTFQSKYEWGFWDIMAWNDVETLDPLDPVQSLHFNEPDDPNAHITAFTNQSMNRARYHAPRYQNAFYQPEQLFSACEKGIEINKDLKGFEYDEERDIWVKKLNMQLEPITYIYLPQVILHHNNGRINYVPGNANLSGLARSTDLNTGVAGTDAIAVSFYMRLKENRKKDGETVDIVGGRLMTFGICGQNGNRVSRAEDSHDSEHHYLDVQMQFYNGMDSTFVFDVTDQVRKRYKGGVITVELDMDTVPVPKRSGGSGFNAVVKDFEDGGTWVIDM